MAGRVCAAPGCPRLIPKGSSRCPDHARPSPEARGYDTTHRQERQAWALRINAGETVNCWRCGKPVRPGAWDLGHVDDERDTAARRAKRWPEHDRECNRSEAGKTSAALRDA